MLLAKSRFWKISYTKVPGTVSISLHRDSLPEDLREVRELEVEVPLDKWNRVIKHVRADRKLLGEHAAAYREQGTPEALALAVAKLAFLVPACDIVRIARVAGLDALEVGRAYFAIGARFGFDWLRRAAGHLPSDGAWDKLAVTAIVDDLYGNQSELTSRVVTGLKDLSAGDGAIDNWAEPRRPLVLRSEQLLAELKSSGTPDLAMLAVANRQLRSMVSD